MVIKRNIKLSKLLTIVDICGVSTRTYNNSSVVNVSNVTLKRKENVKNPTRIVILI